MLIVNSLVYQKIIRPIDQLATRIFINCVLCFSGCNNKMLNMLNGSPRLQTHTDTHTHIVSLCQLSSPLAYEQ